jgi:thioredoxin 1
MIDSRYDRVDTSERAHGRCDEVDTDPQGGEILMAKPQPVTDATFEEQVLKAKGNVLVDFWATWCGPCRAVAPVLDEIANEQGDNLTILKLDIDENQRIAGQFGVMSIPTMILFKDGQPVKQIVGAKPKAALMRDLTPHIG